MYTLTMALYLQLIVYTSYNYYNSEGTCINSFNAVVWYYSTDSEIMW